MELTFKVVQIVIFGIHGSTGTRMLKNGSQTLKWANQLQCYCGITIDMTKVFHSRKEVWKIFSNTSDQLSESGRCLVYLNQYLKVCSMEFNKVENSEYSAMFIEVQLRKYFEFAVFAILEY